MAVIAIVTLLVGMPLWADGYTFNPLWGPIHAVRRFRWAILGALAIRWLLHARATGRWRLPPVRSLLPSAGSLLLSIVTIGMLMPTYSHGKLFIPYFNSQLWDAPLYELERAVHFGFDPSPIILALVEAVPLGAQLIDVTYMSYATLVGFSVAWFITEPCLDARHRFVRGFTMIWLGGLAGYLLLPAHGPIYVFPDLIPVVAQQFPLNFEAQMALLKNYESVQAVLAGQNLPVVTAFGIAALPSLHVAVPAFILAHCFGYGNRLRVFYLAVTLLFLVGSVATGWHYAVDGYAGLLLALVCWWGVRHPVPSPAESPVPRFAYAGRRP